MNKKQDLPIIILGAGGHAKVILDTLLTLKYKIAGIINPTKVEEPFFSKLKYLGNDVIIKHLEPAEQHMANGLGSSQSTLARTQLYLHYQQHHFHFPTLIHPTAIVSRSVQIAQGNQILAGAFIGADSFLSENCIINTRAIIEHECRIGKHSHIATGAILCGKVIVGNNVHIGAGATINQGITIEDGAVIASGSVVIENVKENTLVAGVPAVFKKNISSN